MDNTADNFSENRAETPSTFVRTAQKRGDLFLGLATLFLAALAAVGFAGVAGLGGLGILELGTAMTMIGASIAVLAATEFATLLGLKRTLTVLGRHEAALVSQAERHTALVGELQEQWRNEQARRDAIQDARISNLTERQENERVALESRIAMVSARPSRPARTNGASAEPFGHIHPVKDVEGIGDTYASLLSQIGVRDTAQLWRANPQFVAGKLGVAPKVVEDWQAMCELMAINGIGKQYAELLVRSGIRSIERLAEEDPARLAARVTRTEDKRGNRIQGNTISPKVAAAWVSAAHEHRPTVEGRLAA